MRLQGEKCRKCNCSPYRKYFVCVTWLRVVVKCGFRQGENLTPVVNSRSLENHSWVSEDPELP